MFESLSDKLKSTLKNLRGEGTLTSEHVDAALREIRMALLEADVNYKVAKDFVEAGARQSRRAGGLAGFEAARTGRQNRL
jgi:signal recognition particle subunit SRP54